MEEIGILANGDSPLEESNLLPLSETTEQPDQLGLEDTPMVYKAHAAVGTIILIEGF